MPPFPAAAGGGPEQLSTIRLEVRLSAKHPQISHQTTVPDVMSKCPLPLPALPPIASDAMRFSALLLVLSHFEVASLAQAEDLPLHMVQSQLCPERASSMLCPPLLTGIMGLICLGVRFFLPSIPACRSAFFRWAANAFHLDASESRNGKCEQLLAACVAMPIHFALAFAAAKALFHLPTSDCET